MFKALSQSRYRPRAIQSAGNSAHSNPTMATLPLSDEPVRLNVDAMPIFQCGTRTTKRVIYGDWEEHPYSQFMFCHANDDSVAPVPADVLEEIARSALHALLAETMLQLTPKLRQLLVSWCYEWRNKTITTREFVENLRVLQQKSPRLKAFFDDQTMRASGYHAFLREEHNRKLQSEDHCVRRSLRKRWKGVHF